MKLSNYVIDSLASHGITHIFDVCGGALAHLLDSLYGRSDITTIPMHHEMAAAIAAEGYSRASGNFGVAIATSGPGATNLITGIASCYFDSIPCIFITGQVNTYEYKFNKPVRQIGFQETDIVSIVNPIVKKAMLIKDEKKIRYILEELLNLIKDGRPGPALLDIPLNIQRSDINLNKLRPYIKKSYESIPTIKKKSIDQVRHLIKTSARPIIIAGGGIRSSHAHKELFQFAHATKIPVVASLMGLDAFPHNDALFVGMIGTYGNRYANLAIANSDLIIALGTRFDTRQTGTKPETFARAAKIVHIDIDPHELNNKIRVSHPVHADIKQCLTSLLRVKKKLASNARFNGWIKRINQWKQQYPDYKVPASPNIDPTTAPSKKGLGFNTEVK